MFKFFSRHIISIQVSQFLKFVIVGGSATLLLLVETFVLTEYFHWWYFWAFLVSAVCNWVYLFFAHALFTFKEKKALYISNYAIFVGVYLFALVINSSLVYLFTSWLELYYVVSVILAVGIGTIISYILSKRYVYGHEEHADIIRLKRHFLKQWPAYLLSLFIGLSVVAPHIIWQHDSRYRGIELMGQDAEEHYSARINEVQEGNIGLGNVFLPGKDKPYLQPPLGEIIAALPGQIFSLDAPRTVVLGKFIFPFLIALFVYALIYAISGSRIAAGMGTVFVLLGGEYVSDLHSILRLLSGNISTGEFTIFSRPVNPEVSSLLLFASLTLLYQGWFKRMRPHVLEILLVGLLTGASLYVSPYVFTFLGSVLLGTCVWFFIKKNLSIALRTFAAGLVSFLTLVPFAINYVSLRADENYALLPMRLGFVENHQLIFSIWLALLLGIVLFFWPRAYNQAKVFFVIMVTSLWFLIEQQIVTGIHLQSGHYHWYITKPLVCLTGALVVSFLVTHFIKSRKIRYVLVVAAVAPFLYTSPLLHIPRYMETVNPVWVSRQEYAPVMELLNTLPPGQSVWTDPIMSLYVPIYTRHETPNNFYAVYYLNPESLFERVLFLNYRLERLNPTEAPERFRQDRVKISEYLYGLYYRELTGSSASIPDTILSKLAQKYAEFYARPYADIFNELGLTVVVVLASEKDAYEKIPTLELLQEAGKYIVYTVEK